MIKILLVEPNAEAREFVSARAAEALRQSAIKRAELVPCESLGVNPSAIKAEEGVIALLGPSNHQQAALLIDQLRARYPQSPLALIVENELYTTEAVRLRRELNIRVMPVGDVAQLVQFLLDSVNQIEGRDEVNESAVVTLLHSKGGVGATTLAAGLSSVWARHDLSVALVDLDDVNPQLTAWGRVGIDNRQLLSEFLRKGLFPRGRVNEIVHPVEGFDGRLLLVPQPLRYEDSFHFKADVIEGAPSAADFVSAMIETLSAEFDLVVVDAGRSWGIATFALLPLSRTVLYLLDDDGMSLRRSLDCLTRFVREAESSKEFDLERWRVLFNAYTGKLLSPLDVSREVEEIDLFPETATLFTIPFSENGRQWGAAGVSFYEAADSSVREILEDVAFHIFPFRRKVESSFKLDRIGKSFRSLFSSSSD